MSARRHESHLIRKREKQHNHTELWSAQANYYQHFAKTNTKFDEWTSPRYHETQSARITQMQNDRLKAELIETRRAKLLKLYQSDEQQWQYELMVHKANAKREKHSTSTAAIIPTTVLKELNLGMKVEAEDRRRHQAELALYHQWRTQNPILKHYERMNRGRELKLSWLDQQIEMRMRREKEEEEARRLLAERDKQLREQERREREFEEETLRKREELKKALNLQVEELKQRTKQAEELKVREMEEAAKMADLAQLQAMQEEQKRKFRARECAIFNLKQYKMKLKQKAMLIDEELEDYRNFVHKLQEMEVLDRVQSEEKKKELKSGLDQFLGIVREQKALEKQRAKRFDQIFDSESRWQFEQQAQIWREEEEKRKMLIESVMEEVRKQMEAKMEAGREKQREILREREEMVGKIEEFNRELEELERREKEKRLEWKKCLDTECKVREVRKKARENEEMKKLDMELEQVKREEERLKREIMNMQKKQGPFKPTRSKIFL